MAKIKLEQAKRALEKYQTEHTNGSTDVGTFTSWLESENGAFQRYVVGDTTAVITQSLENFKGALAALHPLPKIPYARDELDEIIEELLLASDSKIKLIKYLNTIQTQVSNVHKYQAKKYTERFYSEMQEGIRRITEANRKIYELTNVRKPVLANTLRRLILEWVEPLRKELNKRISLSANEREELELKTKRLYAQQSFIARQTSFKNKLMEHLKEVGTLFSEPGEPDHRCYISYAWPSEENKGQECWVQPFLYVLYDHLKAAGISMVMDVRNNKPGDSIYAFMQQYKDGNHIILVGTPSLLQKHLSIDNHAVKTELSLIYDRFAEDIKQLGYSRIYPLLISGTAKEAYPAIFDKFITFRDARSDGYLVLVEKLIAWIYGELLKKNRKLEREYLDAWQDFHNYYKGHGGLSTIVGIEGIEKELALGYHRQRLDYLRQDLQYQGVKVQERVEHSNATATKLISVLMESSGINPQNLWDAEGKQFQRPYTNPNFIQRQGLWDKMSKHFEDKEQQILTLTAHGLGGIGKTGLAGYYYLHPPRPYSLRAWFHAESKEQVYQQYIDLIKEMEAIEYPKEMPIEEQVQLVKKWLEIQKDCLLIYDNVTSFKEIEELLPQDGKHHILITSRNSVDWLPSQSLDVNVMEDNEAIDLTVKITAFDKEANQENLKELIQVLDRLPLALTQAGAYMVATSMSIEEYLVVYKESRDKLLTHKSVAAYSPSHEPVWITFDMNFEALQKDCPLALTTLKQASWLSPFDIPENLLLQLMEINYEFPDKQLAWNNIKEHIKRYSLMRIDFERHSLSIHHLLQDILRDKQETIEQIKLFKSVCKVLNKLFFSRKEESFNYNVLLAQAEQLRQHAAYVAVLSDNSGDKKDKLLLLEPICLGYLYSYLGLYSKALVILTSDKSIYETIYGRNNIKLTPTLDCLGNVYRALGDFKEARKAHERALKIKEISYGKNHFKVALTLDYLGIDYRELGDVKKAKDLHNRSLRVKKAIVADDIEVAHTIDQLGKDFRSLGNVRRARLLHEQALDIKKKIYGPNHIEVSFTLDELASSYRYLYLGDFKEAESILNNALIIKERHYGQDHIEVAYTLDHIGKNYRYLGDFKQCKEFHERALKIKEKHYGNNHIEVAYTLHQLGKAYKCLWAAKQAKEMHERALNIKEQFFGKSDIQVAFTLDQLGRDYRVLGMAENAKKLHERAFSLKERYFGKTQVEIASILDHLGRDYRDLGDFKQAKKIHKRALKIKRKYYGKDNFDVSLTLDQLARDYRYLGDVKQAKVMHSRVLRLKEKYYGNEKDTVEIAVTLVQLGIDYCELGDFKKAKEIHERSVTINEKWFGENHIAGAYALEQLGVDYRKLGDSKKAKEIHKQVLKIKEKYYGKDHPIVAYTIDYLGEDHTDLGDVNLAQKLHERSLKIKKKHFGEFHPEAAETYTNLGGVYIKLGNVEQGKKYLERALNIREHYYGMNNHILVETLMELANAYKCLKKSRLALNYLERSLKIAQKYFGKNHFLAVAIKLEINSRGSK